MHETKVNRNLPWLLIDAAGPVLVTGLVLAGRWLSMHTRKGEILENLKPGVEAALAGGGTRLHETGGCLYAAGPGSILGLRLSAIFIKGLKQIPALAGWTCLSYNNLVVAAAAHSLREKLPCLRMAAPWKKQTLHLVEFDSRRMNVRLATTDPETAGNQSLPIVELGRRAAGTGSPETRLPYPHEEIPRVLETFPGLLTTTPMPEPYFAKAPEFVRWNAVPHASA